ncbi:MAG: GNAT family acetyltransferase [Gammaproteobacteria bacterium]|nr:GNAT family acetyltransferase [Gammaproteobacteria bacterium]
MLKIRQFESSDKKAVIQLWHECNLVVPWNDPEKDIKRKLNVGGEYFLVGEFEDELVASVMGGYDGHRGYVNYLVVAPMYRSRGFAHMMMAGIETRLKAAGCPKINLMVRKTNIDTVEFYESLGYRVDQSVILGKRLIADN